MQTEPTYLGDGVYANFDGMHVVIGTGGAGEYLFNTIFLDQTVWQALVDYGRKVFAPPVEDTIYGNCSVCGEPITDNDYHRDYDGNFCHEQCCPKCNKARQSYAA